MSASIPAAGGAYFRLELEADPAGGWRWNLYHVPRTGPGGAIDAGTANTAADAMRAAGDAVALATGGR